jgi:hypothetical protein
MPQDVNCPKCTHSFPVTEARHAFTVACPRCEAELTAEFKKPATPPEAGQPPYDLLVKSGALPGTVAPPPVPRKKKEEDDEPKRKGGSAMIVLVSGGLGLLFVLGGLSVTGWFLFTQIDVETASTNRPNSSSSSSSSGTNPKGTNPKNTNPKNTNPKFPPGFPTDPDPGFPPVKAKPVDTFDLRPVVGALPAIAPPTLPADPSNAPLGGKVGQIAIGGGGRYIVMHRPDEGKLGFFDVSAAKLYWTDADNGDVKLAAGLSRAVVYSPSANIFRVYSLPDLQKQFDFSSANITGLRNIAMGSRTNGPLLGTGTFGDPVLIELGANEMKEVEGTRKERAELHWNMLRASPDGTAFTTFDGFRNNKVTLLTVENRRWKVQKDIDEVPFLGGDGNLYGNGVVRDRSGQDQRFVGLVGARSGEWLVPAVSGNTHFLKCIHYEEGKGSNRKRVMRVTVHANRNANPNAAVATVDLTGVPEFEGLWDGFGKHPAVPLDQHLFLVPEAKLLITLTSGKDRLVLRRLDLP